MIRQGDGDLLSLVPIDAYTKPYTYLGYSRRSILLINDPEIARDVLTDPLEIFPKNDLMVGALEPLVGDSIFVSSGERWRRQRTMIDPAFSHMRISTAFPSMTSAVDDYERKLDGRADRDESFSLDLAMSELFGGFGARFYDAYDEARGRSDAYASHRRDLYQLYFLLVHVNLFGASYVDRSRSAARRVVSALR